MIYTYKDKQWLNHIKYHGTPMTELRDVTCHMRSHSVTCNPTQVNAFRLDLPTREGWKAELT